MKECKEEQERKNSKMKILAIETSCDETSIALLEEKTVIQCLTWSQIKSFTKYGGVVPQIASYLHSVKLPLLLAKLIKNKQLNWKEISCIAYTKTPGLIGCLKIGETLAKTVGLIKKIKVMAINHLYGHIFAAKLTKDFSYPALAAVVSGGHTQLIYLPKELDFQILGTTLDDALGETLDKIGRVLQLPYPAGPKIEQLAKKGKNSYNFKIFDQKDDYNFSFSGIKTDAIRLIRKEGKNLKLDDFAHSLQTKMFENVKKKITNVLKWYPVKNLILAGGVASNEQLRVTIRKIKLPLIVPPKIYCTDNAVMIGILAYYKLQKE